MFVSELPLKELVDGWMECTLPGDKFNHAAHLSVCSYLIWHKGLAESYVLMREGLYRFNEATGTPNSDERGYHETLTRFWCTVLFFGIHRGHFKSCVEAANGMLKLYGSERRAERPYYSFDVLASKDARRRWIPPDYSATVAREGFYW